ncbi:MAG: 50S ribosomal protein L9 [Planctomycetota bacterium]|nr:MAG: 50S ribosomal protein L9 [Planctomycetota bacterium]
MKLLLLESVDGLGRPGDQVDVKPGFARNYLVPQGKAVRVSPDTLRMLGRLQEKAEAEERALVSSMQELAAKVDGFAVKVNARATEEGHLFGSVTEKDVHAAMAAAGWTELTVRQVRMHGHLKEAGEHEVELHLFGEIEAKVMVTIVPVDSDGYAVELEEFEDDDEGGEAGEGDASTGNAATETPADGSSPEAAATVDA